MYITIHITTTVTITIISAMERSPCGPMPIQCQSHTGIGIGIGIGMCIGIAAPWHFASSDRRFPTDSGRGGSVSASYWHGNVV